MLLKVGLIAIDRRGNLFLATFFRRIEIVASTNTSPPTLLTTLAFSRAASKTDVKTAGNFEPQTPLI